MNDINVGDTIRNKETGVIGKVISDSSFIDMYRVDTGENCEWMEYKDVEKVKVIEDEGK